MRGLPRLVVLDDPARAERVEVDPVDLAGEREGVEIEPSLQLRRRPLRPERNLEPARDELELRGRFVAHEGFEIAEQALLELAPLEVGQLHPDPGHRLREALAQELERPVELLRTQLLDPELLRQTGEELVQRRVCDLAAQARVDLLVDRARADDAVDEPDRRAVGERLQLGDAEAHPRAQLLEHERMGQAGRPVERAECPFEAALPAVRLRQRARGVSFERDEGGDRPQALALRRGLLDRPRER